MHDNVAIVRGAFEALNRGDIEAVLRICDPQIELRPSLVGGIEKEVFRGREGYKRWFEEVFQVYDEVHFDVQDIRAIGDRVVGFYVTRIRGARSGIELEAPGATVITLRDGLATHQVGYGSREEALREVGLTTDEASRDAGHT